MTVCRKLPDGTIQKIAGHTILLDANASEVREGTVTVPEYSGEPRYHELQVTFSDPMPDTDYAVAWNIEQSSYWAEKNIKVGTLATTGFKFYVTIENGDVSPAGTVIHYIAWKPVKIEGYTALQNKVNNPDDTPTIDSMNLVTSDGVARAIENASAVWKGTKAEWTALPATDKIKYDLAVLLDQTLVKAIDRTDGTETNVADLSGQFVGTHAEWEAESNKTQYKTAVLTDDRKTVNEVTGTGALNEVADDARIWRGTKEEWEALTDAEKDEWDQAEIETIEPKDMNPFRTLSDTETLSIAPNTDYTCPHDGFIVTSPAGVAVVRYFINNVQVAQSGRDSTAGSTETLPVQKGDVFKYALASGSGAVNVIARWYTNETSPGPTDTPVLYRSQSLDWDSAVYPTNAEMLAGWTAPSDGYFIDWSIPEGAASDYLTINGIQISYAMNSSGAWATHGVQIPVAKGDVLKHTRTMYPGSYWTNPVIFVPYKDYPDYSTEEHWTGKRWIDGRKVYSKTFTGTATNGTSVPHGITGLGTVVGMNGCIWYGNTIYMPFTSSDDGYTTRPSVQNSIIEWVIKGFGTVNYNLTVEYTKTTD